MSAADTRRYAVDARSTETFGRVLCNCREHHFVVDGPVHNGCPGEELTPAELFLAGVAACGVELLQVIARADGVPLGRVKVEVEGELDPAAPVREDLTVFNSVRLAFRLEGVGDEEASRLVERFKRR